MHTELPGGSTSGKKAGKTMLIKEYAVSLEGEII